MDGALPSTKSTAAGIRVDSNDASAMAVTEMKPVGPHRRFTPAPPVTTAVLLGASRGTALCAVSSVLPRYLWPEANRPACVRMLRSLQSLGIRSVVLNCSHPTTISREKFLRQEAEALGMEFTLREETVPLGTAGAVRASVEPTAGARVLVVSMNMLATTICDALPTVRRLLEEDGAASLLVSRAGGDRALDQLRVGPDGTVEQVGIGSTPEDAVSTWTSAGLWVLRADALELIPPRVHYSIREQLLPELLQAGLPVRAAPLKVREASVGILEQYLEQNRAAIVELPEDQSSDGPAGEASRIRISPRAIVSPGARLEGSVVVGAGSRIEDGVVIQGPCSIGEGCVVRSGVTIRESILWDRVHLGRNAEVFSSVLTDGAVVLPRVRVRDQVMLSRRLVRSDNARARGTVSGVAGDIVLDAPRRMVATRERRVRHVARDGFKRVFDVVLAVTVLVVSLPLMLVAAVLIKLESSGPVLFRQQRCARDGRAFTMLKLRTMVADAEQLQAQLRAQNEADGPMFKMSKDPRITRVGAFLRKSCLDEVPQMINVLRGEMSIVGPRPLAAHEMTMNPAWRDLRLRVRPGITGLWQVCGREHQSFSDWIRYDIEYVQNPSLATDMKILVRTAFMILACLRRDRS